MQNTVEFLCSRCQTIKLDSYFQEERNVNRQVSGFVGPGRDARVFCSLADLWATCEVCTLCALVMQALRLRWGPEMFPTVDNFIEWAKTAEGLDGDPQIYLYSYLFAEEECDAASVPPLNNDKKERQIRSAFRVGIALRGASDKNAPYLDHAGDIQLVSLGSLVHEPRPTFYGRILDPSRADIQLAKEWISECEQSHGRLCETPTRGGDVVYAAHPAEDLRVIDVNSMCLVSLPKEAKYIALSYCWAQSRRQFITTTSNVGNLEVLGSLWAIRAELPGSIQDAIDFVREIGREFLWVDALCIVQDDQKDKHKQIQQMDRVYDSALLTIISAPPATEDGSPLVDGLPGYRCRLGRQPVQARATIQGLELCTTVLSVEQVIMSSPWVTRAWTFQEHLLSKRRLFFTHMQLYFECSCGMSCEDVVGEGKSPSAFIYPGTSLWNVSGLHNYLTEGQKGGALGLSRSKFPGSLEAFTYYTNIVEQYSRREMTCQGDALLALEGVMAVLRKTMDTEFIHGIPEAFLDEALLWHPAGFPQRRVALPNDTLSLGFPSWSWAGWNVMSNYRLQFDGPILREVEWYLVNGQGIGFHLLPPRSSESPRLFDGSSSEDIRPRGNPPDTFLNALRPRPELRTEDLNSCTLACWTSVATFQMLGDKVDSTVEWESHGAFAISDDKSQPVGTIFLEKSWDGVIAQNQGKGFSFMLLSRSEMIDIVPPLNNAFPITPWCFVNVMLIRKNADNAERLGVGVVHKLAWVSAGPEATLIHLR